MKKIVRKCVYLVGFILLWEVVYIFGGFHELLFPSSRAILSALIKGVSTGEYLSSAAVTLRQIFMGLSLGAVIALCLLLFSQLHRYCLEIVDTLVTIMNPIPGIAIFPLCILWFGFGENAVVFILIHSVVWSFLLNVLQGFKAIPLIYEDIAKNYELSRFAKIKDIYIPASTEYIIAGFRVAVGGAWRSAISVEIVAGIVAGNAGMGWLMTYQRNMLDIPGLFSSIIVIIVVGLFLEEVVVKTVERLTVRKWGISKWDI